jgi:hypothetical protein
VTSHASQAKIVDQVIASVPVRSSGRRSLPEGLGRSRRRAQRSSRAFGAVRQQFSHTAIPDQPCVEKQAEYPSCHQKYRDPRRRQKSPWDVLTVSAPGNRWEYQLICDQDCFWNPERRLHAKLLFKHFQYGLICFSCGSDGHEGYQANKNPTRQIRKITESTCQIDAIRKETG